MLIFDHVLDTGLTALHDDCDVIYVCSQQPGSYPQTITYGLGSKNFGAGNAFGPPGARAGGGRQISSSIKTGGAGREKVAAIATSRYLGASCPLILITGLSLT